MAERQASLAMGADADHLRRTDQRICRSIRSTPRRVARAGADLDRYARNRVAPQRPDRSDLGGGAGRRSYRSGQAEPGPVEKLARPHVAAPQKLGVRGHHAAMPYDQLPEFMARLAETPGIAAKALIFLILTATRTTETLGAQWDEISFRLRTGKFQRADENGRSVQRPIVTTRRCASSAIKWASAARALTFFPVARASRCQT